MITNENLNGIPKKNCKSALECKLAVISFSLSIIFFLISLTFKPLSNLGLIGGFITIIYAFSLNFLLPFILPPVLAILSIYLTITKNKKGVETKKTKNLLLSSLSIIIVVINFLLIISKVFQVGFF